MERRERCLALVARQQHGAFTRAQAVAAGFPSATISRRLAVGAWERLGGGVYGMAAAEAPTDRQLLWAAILSCGPDAVVSHRSAAYLFELLDEAPVPEITVPPGRRGRSGLLVHRCDLPPSQVVERGGLSITRLSRTLVDCAGVMRRRNFEDMLDTALRRGLVTWRDLHDTAHSVRQHGRSGPSLLLASLRERRPGDSAAESVWEARVLRLLRRAGLPEPVPQYRVVVGRRLYRVDFAWPEAKIALEFDGYGPHAGLEAFTRDRVRGNALMGEGWRVFHLTAQAIREAGVAVLADVAAALGSPSGCGNARY